MIDKNYSSKEAKETLLMFAKDMADAWEDFLINQETVSALLEEIRENETEESYKAICEEMGWSVEAAETMIATYREEANNGKNEKRYSA